MQKVKENLKWYFLGFLFLVTLFIWANILYADRGGVLTVAFLDVGQGDSVFIEAPNGNQILIDGGPGRIVLRELGKVMPFYDRSIDVVLVTHPDGDHAGGLPSVIENFAVGTFIESGVSSNTKTYEALLNAIAEQEVAQVLARRGLKIVLDSQAGIVVEILFPDRDVADWNPNDASIIARLVYGEHSFLFTGDSPQAIENYLTYLDKGNLESEVLKVGHHGSKTSTSALFISEVKPRYAVISAGYNNRYGHPHEEVLNILTSLGAKVLGTYDQGTIVFHSDGGKLWIK